MASEPSHVASGRNLRPGTPVSPDHGGSMSRELTTYPPRWKAWWHDWRRASFRSPPIACRRRASSGVPDLIVTSDEGLAEEGEVRVTLPGGEAVAAQIVGRDPKHAPSPCSRSSDRICGPSPWLRHPRCRRAGRRSGRGGRCADRGARIVVGQAGALAIDARRRDRRPHRARHASAPDGRGRSCGQCRGPGLRHDGVRTSPARAGDTRAHHRPGSGEAWRPTDAFRAATWASACSR